MTKFSRKLSRLCEAMGWDAPELARRISLSDTTARRWLDGEREPSHMPALSRLFAETGVDARYLIDENMDEPPAGLSDAERAVVDLMRAIGIEKGEALKRIASPFEPTAGPPRVTPLDPKTGRPKTDRA